MNLLLSPPGAGKPSPSPSGRRPGRGKALSSRFHFSNNTSLPLLPSAPLLRGRLTAAQGFNPGHNSPLGTGHNSPLGDSTHNESPSFPPGGRLTIPLSLWEKAGARVNNPEMAILQRDSSILQLLTRNTAPSCVSPRTRHGPDGRSPIRTPRVPRRPTTNHSRAHRSRDSLRWQ